MPPSSEQQQDDEYVPDNSRERVSVSRAITGTDACPYHNPFGTEFPCDPLCAHHDSDPAYGGGCEADECFEYQLNEGPKCPHKETI